MKMGKYTICCPDCLGKISKKSTYAGKFWMELCGYYFHFGPFLRVSDFVGAPKDLLVLLEKEGYLLSTEDCSKGGRKDELVIKIQGFPTFENGNEIFCIGNH